MLLLLAFLFYFNTKEDTKGKVVFSKERIFNLNLQESEFLINFDFSAYKLKKVNDKVALLNFNNQTIYLYDNSGNVIDSIGYGKGPSPIESSRIYYYESELNYFYFFDVDNYNISKVNTETAELESFYREGVFYKAIRIKDDEFILLSRNTEGFLEFKNIILGSSNDDTNKFNQLTNIFPKEKYNWWIYDGDFHKDLYGNLYYYTLFSDQLIKFNSEGKILKSINLIHQTPLIVLTTQNEMTFPSENSNESILDITSDESYIYLLSNVSNEGRRILDVYDIQNLSYMKSIILPNFNDELPVEIENINSTFYVLYETVLKSFKE